jgi:hypothetical protein
MTVLQVLPWQAPRPMPSATTSEPSRTAQPVRSGSSPRRQLTRTSRVLIALAVTDVGASGLMRVTNVELPLPPPLWVTVQVPLGARVRPLQEELG